MQNAADAGDQMRAHDAVVSIPAPRGDFVLDGVEPLSEPLRYRQLARVNLLAGNDLTKNWTTTGNWKIDADGVVRGAYTGWGHETADDVLTAGTAQGYSKSTVHRARQQLGLRVMWVGRASCWALKGATVPTTLSA